MARNTTSISTFELLRSRALAAGVPPVAVKVHLNLWKGPRVFKLGKHYSPKALFAESGLPAGSAWNDVYVRAYALAPFDRFILANPLVSLGSYVDDDGIIASGTVHQALTRGWASAEALHLCFKHELKVGLALDKSFTIGSFPKLATVFAAGLTDLAGTVARGP